MKVSLLTGGADKPYSLGLLQALIAKGVTVDFIGNDEMSTADIITHSSVNLFNLRGDQRHTVSNIVKIYRVIIYYVRLVKYTTSTDTKLFHILWLNKFVYFDRVILNLYYKLIGKKLVYTAHNIDDKQRDGGNSILNKITLRIMYSLLDHVFVHTTKMKAQLIDEFKMEESKVSIIPFGINDTIPKSSLTKSQARAILQLNDHEKVLLFFGNIAPYKGLEHLIYAMDQLKTKGSSIRLIIAGQIKGCQTYWQKIEHLIDDLELDCCITKFTKYIPDKEVEIFFKSSDVLILPYKFIFQSGVLFLSYSFGLPLIATDVGSLKEDIEEGKTGMICRAEDPDDLADTVRRYFDSDLFKNIEESMRYIISYGNEKYSWDKVGNITCDVYDNVLSE